VKVDLGAGGVRDIVLEVDQVGDGLELDAAVGGGEGEFGGGDGAVVGCGEEGVDVHGERGGRMMLMMVLFGTMLRRTTPELFPPAVTIDFTLELLH